MTHRKWRRVIGACFCTQIYEAIERKIRQVIQKRRRSGIAGRGVDDGIVRRFDECDRVSVRKTIRRMIFIALLSLRRGIRGPRLRHALTVTMAGSARIIHGFGCRSSKVVCSAIVMVVHGQATHVAYLRAYRADAQQ